MADKRLTYLQFAKKLKLPGSKFAWGVNDVEKHSSKDRSNRFGWNSDHLEIHPPVKDKINEKTYDKPVKHEDWDDDNPRQNKNSDHSKHQFHNHAHDIEHDHEHHKGDHPSVLSSIHHYKEEGHEEINDHLRHGSKLDGAHKHHIKNLDHATNHPIHHEMHVFRGVPPHAHDFRHMKPGTEFTDHGYTSTSVNHKTASSFSGPRGKRHVFKIHLPKGTKAHHFDEHENSNNHEKEVVLHRGTRFKVTHHSEDSDHHYIHATVLGHHPKDID